MKNLKTDLKKIRNNLNYWYNLFYRNYEDLNKLLKNWKPENDFESNEIGRLWFNYLCSEIAFRNKVTAMRSRLEDLKIFSSKEYNKRLKETGVAEYNDIIKKYRNSLGHDLTPEEDWGIKFNYGFRISVTPTIDIESKKAMIEFKSDDISTIKLMNEDITLGELIAFHTISQRVFLSWINKEIDRHLDPKDRLGGYAIDALNEYKDE